MSKTIVYYGSTASFSNLYSDNLDGVDEFLSAGDQSAFSFGNGGIDSAFSGSIWIKRNATGNASMICKAQVAATRQEYFFVILSNQLYFWCVDASGAGARIGRITTVTITDTNWHHCAFTYSGNKSATGIKIYIDSVQRDTVNFNFGAYNGMSDTTAPLRFGVANEASTWATNGKLAHQKIFNKELSAAEVLEDYNLKMNDARTLSFAANLVSAYYFPNGTSDYSIQTDYQSGYNATMTNQESADINIDVPI